jgi:hypothetical protein
VSCERFDVIALFDQTIGHFSDLKFVDARVEVRGWGSIW